jgi:glutamate dehydrogenase
VTTSAAVDIVSVVNAVASELPARERPLAAAFTRHLFERAGADLLTTLPLARLVRIALSTYSFATAPGDRELRVRVLDVGPAEAGWDGPLTVVQTLLRDRPFIVDTILECLREDDCTVRRLVHPIFGADRDVHGVARVLSAPGLTGHNESLVHVETDPVADPDAVAARLTERLRDLIHATDDYTAMRRRAEEIARDLRADTLPAPWSQDAEEVADFVDWLGQRSFVFLGYREYQYSAHGDALTAVVRPDTGLGILRAAERSAFASPRPVPDRLQRRLREPPLIIVSKTNAESPVQRRAHMDYVGIKEVSAVGTVIGERRFLGLFTAKAYADEPTAVPLLRRKLATILEAEGAAEGSHDYKAIVAIFNRLPAVELMASEVAGLHRAIKAILTVQSTGSATPRVLHRSDTIGRGEFVTVIVPRDRFSDALYRQSRARLAAALGAVSVLEERLVLEEDGLARMHFYFALPAGAVSDIARDDLERAVRALLETWDDRLRAQLRTEYTAEEAARLTDRYSTIFSAEYKAANAVVAAARGIRHLECVAATRAAQVDVSNDDATPSYTTLRLFLLDDLVLSNFLPILENLGLTVHSADRLDLVLPDTGLVRTHTFLVQDQDGARLMPEPAARLLTPAILLLHAGRLENDRLNTLILSAGLDWRQVDLLRTYVNHGVQIGTAPNRQALVRALIGAAAPARVLWRYFAAKLDPGAPDTPVARRAAGLPALQAEFVASLDAVPGVAEDRMLRRLFDAVSATVRTSFFVPSRSPHAGADAEPAAPGPIAVKLDPRRIPHLPRPRPRHEIYVHAPQLEGIHLRAADVARGGVRLSDRPHDFRTEILDLMKTQVVKNSVIVPAGAKGGFVVKTPHGSTRTPALIVDAYRIFIRSLLGLTDNLVGGRIVPPREVLCDDPPDPYLVVAADKGTATFSDVANEIATQEGFWLGDAFASGGRHGYDHKRQGITARGAWECVRRHFREMGRDADRDVITVIGIGDMSGDVFGNGLLLSRHVKLLAAFNHLHIFLDPDPDPERSYAERERLFRLPRSAWTDYRSEALGPGGGVYLRSAKTIQLSAAARTWLGLPGEDPSGEEVIRAILHAKADLLWNGGIGTYVKATDESHTAVGDSANDSVRVNGADLGVEVVAEGGNLGFTQRGRVEFALRGGRINTDAIDNSGGVDMSDHEVNVKIACAGGVEAGALTMEERNQLLIEIEPVIAAGVLAHNRRQALCLSLDQTRSQARLADFRDLMGSLEGAGLLDRQLEGLPAREALRNRRATFVGLTRPELAVLLAHSKLALQQALLASSLPDDPFFDQILQQYFPPPVAARCVPWLHTHRLRREIIAVELANLLIDAMGATFVTRVSRDTGTDPAMVARAWAIVAAAGDATDLWRTLLANPPPALTAAGESQACTMLAAALERATRWIVEAPSFDEPTGDLAGRLHEPVRKLLAALPDLLPAVASEALQTEADTLLREGLPQPLAGRLAALSRLAEVLDIVDIAADVGLPVRKVAEVSFRLAEIVDVDWVRRSLSEQPAEDRWERRAVEGLQQGLTQAHRRLTRAVLGCHEGGEPVERCLAAYSAAHRVELEKLGDIVSDIKNAPHATLPALLVVMRELGRLAGARD